MAAKPPTTPPPSPAVEIVYVVDSDLAQRSHVTPASTRVSDLVALLASQLGRPELDTLYLEDAGKPLKSKDEIGNVLGEDFVVLHLGGKHDVEVEVLFNGQDAKTKFARGVTMRAIIEWAVSKKGLGLEGDPSDFQLKLADDIQPPERHIGQVAQDRQPVRLSLVFKIKPQG